MKMADKNTTELIIKSDTTKLVINVLQSQLGRQTQANENSRQAKEIATTVEDHNQQLVAGLKLKIAEIWQTGHIKKCHTKNTFQRKVEEQESFWTIRQSYSDQIKVINCRIYT